MKKKNGFTLIELLAVIVILAIILVIAVPKILSVINDATKNSFESSLKMIASSAEKIIKLRLLKVKLQQMVTVRQLLQLMLV